MSTAAQAEQERRVLVGLAAWVRGEWRISGAADADQQGTGQACGDQPTAMDWLHVARVHGVSELIGQAGVSPPVGGAAVPDSLAPLLRSCRDDLRAGVALEMLRKAELCRVLEALHAAGVDPLILKGSALAYDLYATPELRPRADTDLLMPPGSEAAVQRTLGRLGYACDDSNPTEHVHTQSSWSCEDRLGAHHQLDVHRTANNSPLLAAAFPYAELRSRARALPALGPYALGLGDADALLLACVHRAGHSEVPYHVDDDIHEGGDRLIWFYDMHLLLKRMDEVSLRAFVDRARQAQMAGLCHDALSVCVACFGTPLPPNVMQALHTQAGHEPSLVYLRGSSRERAWHNWRALPSWRHKAVWTWELGFPSQAHMRRKYAQSPRSPLAWLYVRRAWQGITRLLQK